MGGGFPIWTYASFLVLYCRGFSRLVLFLVLGVVEALARNIPKRVRNTIRTFPEKKWETPWLGISQKLGPAPLQAVLKIHENGVTSF